MFEPVSSGLPQNASGASLSVGRSIDPFRQGSWQPESVSCWVLPGQAHRWASQPLEYGLSSAPGVFVFVVQTPLHFFPSWALTKKSETEGIDSFWEFWLSYGKENFQSSTSLPAILIRDAVELAGALQREALQTIPRHQSCSPPSTFLGEGPVWRERMPLGSKGRGSWTPKGETVTWVENMVLSNA